jgi:hypothetical protein
LNDNRDIRISIEVEREERERENGGFLRLIGEDQVFNNLDFVVSIYEMKRNINVFSYNSVK